MTHAKFRIGNAEYDFPTIDTFTMDEAIVLYDYSGVTLDTLDDVEGVHPGVLAALAHVAIQRADPDMKPAHVKALVRGLNLLELIAGMPGDEDEDKPDPPQTPSPGSSAGSETSSGDGSSNDSDPPAPDAPTSSGTPE